MDGRGLMRFSWKALRGASVGSALSPRLSVVGSQGKAQMKIRTVIMLLAVSFFGLPTYGQEIRLRSYIRETKQDNGCVVPGDEYLTWVLKNKHEEDSLWVDPFDNGAFYTRVWEDSCPYWLTNHNAGEIQQSWGISYNGVTPNGQDQGWQWQDDGYSEWNREILPFGYYWPIIQWERCLYTNVTVMEPHEPSGLVVTNTFFIHTDARVELLTGGESNSTRQALFEVTVEATEGFNIVVPPPVLSVLGKTTARKPGDTNAGVVYKKLADNTIVDATVSAPRDCYRYSVWASKAYLILTDGDWYNEVTDQTQVIYAGERVALECRLSDYIGAEITDYQWSVPGSYIGGWAINPNYSITGEVLPAFPPGLHVSTNAVTFYPVAEGTITVSCTVQVEGETMTASTTYEVRKPTAWWRVWPKGPHGVEVTTHFGSGGYYLTTGHGTSIDDVGVRYDYQITDLRGYTNAFLVHFGQWMTSSDKGNVELPGKPYKSWWRWERGLDATPGPQWWYKYWDNQMGTVNQPVNADPANDTPNNPLPNTIRYFKRTDNFVSLLFWQSNRGRHSIPVPLSKAEWNWAGETKKIQGNNVWYLYSRTQPQLTYGQDWNWHPAWDHRMNMPAPAPNTNDFFYPEPAY